MGFTLQFLHQLITIADDSLKFPTNLTKQAPLKRKPLTTHASMEESIWYVKTEKSELLKQDQVLRRYRIAFVLI